jgi:hypothetical protein
MNNEPVGLNSSKVAAPSAMGISIPKLTVGSKQSHKAENLEKFRALKLATEAFD